MAPARRGPHGNGRRCVRCRRGVRRRVRRRRGLTSLPCQDPRVPAQSPARSLAAADTASPRSPCRRTGRRCTCRGASARRFRLGSMRRRECGPPAHPRSPRLRLCRRRFWRRAPVNLLGRGQGRKRRRIGGGGWRRGGGGGNAEGRARGRGGSPGRGRRRRRRRGRGWGRGRGRPSPRARARSTKAQGSPALSRGIGCESGAHGEYSNEF